MTSNPSSMDTQSETCINLNLDSTPVGTSNGNGKLLELDDASSKLKSHMCKYNENGDKTVDSVNEKPSKGRKRRGKRKDKSSVNGVYKITDDNHSKERTLNDGVGREVESKRTADCIPPKEVHVHEHLNSRCSNHVNEPLHALAQMVEKLGMSEGSQQELRDQTEVPSDQTSKNGGIDESLAIAKCNSEDEDDADLELPSSLSDFVLGYQDDCHYAVTKLPPNDDDIDSICVTNSDEAVRLVPYKSELQMPDIIRLITKDLSEPYSIYTYRYFIHNWPNLCFLAMHGSQCVGAIVCKLDVHKKMVRRGYIAMLAVDKDYRKQKLGSSLVKKAIRAMVRGECDEVVLETEITNKSALRLYQNLGFVRDKRLFRYYLNGVDALRLKLWLR